MVPFIGKSPDFHDKLENGTEVVKCKIYFVFYLVRKFRDIMYTLALLILMNYYFHIFRYMEPKFKAFNFFLKYIQTRFQTNFLQVFLIIYSEANDPITIKIFAYSPTMILQFFDLIKNRILAGQKQPKF